MSQTYLVLDYETRSEIDLGDVGAWEYARHPSTQIMCVSWRIGTRETLRIAQTRTWSPSKDVLSSGRLPELIAAFRNPAIILVAHNALFEQVITRHVLPRYMKELIVGLIIDPDRWMCTAAMAAVLALPRALEGACAALKLPVQKDMEGNKLVKKMMRPRKPTKKDPSRWHYSKAELLRLIAYCETDIAAEVELFLRIPELTPFERRVWLLDQRMNLRGMKIDRDFVKHAITLADEETANIIAETGPLSGGEFESTTQVAQMIKWLGTHGVVVDNLQKKTVEDLLKEELHPQVRRMLEIRKEASRVSTGKYYAAEERSRSDGRVRDNTMYHGASTGRFTGAGLQVHNFVKPALWIKKHVDFFAEFLLDLDLEELRILCGNPMEVLSSLTRSMIRADEGKLIFSGDYSSIEVRVLFWLADHEEGLKAYRENRDLYREICMDIYHKALIDVTSDEREVGKRVILGAGFSMGAPKFEETCEQYGQPVSTKLAQTAISAYRERHAPVVELWRNLERASISAVRHPGRVFETNHTKWWAEKGFLWCELPSGRRLAYCDPKIKVEVTSWGERRPKLYFWGVHPKTKQWVEQGTYGGALTENITQATARDLMVAGMLRVEASREFEMMMTVHDEVVAQGAPECTVERFLALLTELPAWAAGVPVKADGWRGPRYRKG